MNAEGLPLLTATESVGTERLSRVTPVSISSVVGSNLRRLRSERNLSVSQLARRSGIAKATLSNLEAGEGNPTVQTLNNLAEALGVLLGDLLEVRTPSLVRAADAQVIDDPTSFGRRLFRAAGAAADVFDITFRDGSRHHSQFRSPGAMEHTYVLSGRLEVVIGERTEILEAGDLIRYPLEEGAELKAVGGDARVILVIEFAQPGESPSIRPLPL
nr:XRE family transcriptional regulator [Kribbella solani]